MSNQSDNELYDKIEEAKTIIGDSAIDIISKHLNLINFKEEGSTKRAMCPFGTHDDKTPSFTWNDDKKYFHCFSCGKNYGILDLLVETEGNYKKAVNKLFEKSNLTYDFAIKEENEDFFNDYTYPEEEKNIDRKKVEEYCAKRQISVKTLDYMGIKQDKHGNVVFELKDLDNKLLAIKYRPSRAVKNNEPKMWWYEKKDVNGNKLRCTCPTLFNMNKIDFTKPLLIVEGYFDCLSCFEAGFSNVVSIHGGAQDLKWIQFNFDFLEQFQEIILWYDNDKAGQDGLTQTIARLGEYRCKIVSPDKTYEDKVSTYYIQNGVKKEIRKTDANNILLACGKFEVLKLITNAKEIPSKRLKYLMDCEPTNVKDMEKVSTGFLALDKLIYGTLFPCFTIYTGSSGSGKSSLANISCLIAPVEAGYKTFVYSGELDKGQLSDWIFSPLAGRKHTLQFEKEGGRPSFSVAREALKCIKKYYRPDFILYDDEEALDTSSNVLLDEMYNAYRKYGCRVFLIDNLMTLSVESLNEDSQWDAQKKLIKKLLRFSDKYSVSVNLIVHPKKPSAAGYSHSIYDLHGASEIGNLCHRLLWVDRLEDDEEGCNIKISIIKDRPSQASGKFCKLYYDYATRRIYSDDIELNKSYSWEKSFNVTYTEENKKKLVCNLTKSECNQF